MSQPISPSVLKREVEGIGRLYEAGIGPDGLWGLKVPSHYPWSSPSCIAEGGCLTTEILAGALCVRANTVREYIRESGIKVFSAVNGLPGADAQDWEDVVISKEECIELLREEYGVPLDPDDPVIDCEELCYWVFEHKKHRTCHRWAWWELERALGTWTPEGGYIDALPMTKAKWTAVNHVLCPLHHNR